MQFKTRSSFALHATLALIVALLLLLGTVPGQALAAPVAAPLPPSTACTPPGTGLVVCELWATSGTITLPGGASLPIWGYSDSAAGAAQLPGPVLIAQEGDQVQVTLHNALSVVTALYFDGQALPPDRVGVSAGASGVYEFTAITPGVFLYEAAPLPGAHQQVAMGLFGALIVRPAGTPGQAYANPASAFDDEALLVLSEIDPALNNNPLAFDMRRYQPKYWLINGKAYPDTEPILTAAGNRLLLRYVNAGLQTHTMALLGGYQKFLALGGAELPFYRNLVSEELGPGQSADALVTIPASAPPGMRYPLYEASMLLHNNGAPGFGGMITFLTIPAGPGNGDTQGPSASGISLSPNPANGAVDVAISATLSDAASGGSNIQAAEFFIDATGASGSGFAMSAVDQDGFNSSIEAVSGLISTSTLAGLSSGNHTLYIHGQDSAGNWGSFNVAVLNLDKTGPTSRAIVLTPGASNGSLDIAIQATGDDSASGNGEQSSSLIRYLRQNPKLGLVPIVVLDVEPRHLFYLEEIPVVPAEQLLFDASYQNALGIDTAIVVSTGVPEDWMSRLTRYQGGNFRRLIIVPGLDRVSNLSLTSLNLGGILSFELQHNLLNEKEQTLKRFLDLALTIVGGLLISPFLLLIAVLIKLDSKGPVLYGHTRLGLNGRKFKVWKFRTMFPNADQVLEDYLQAHPELRQEWDSLHKLKDDPRVTRVGRFLRKYSLDEFPQLWNVLRGEMSLVGPRPIVEDEICRYDDCYEFYTQVKPGITGMWQISGRNDTTYEERVRLDEFYVRNWSVWLDIVILARTVWVVLRPRGAY